MTTKISNTGVLTDEFIEEDVKPTKKPFWSFSPLVGLSANNPSFGTQVKSTKVQLPFCKQLLSTAVEAAESLEFPASIKRNLCHISTQPFTPAISLEKKGALQ